MSNEALTLSQLNAYIKQTIAENFVNYYWLVAEIGEMNTNRTGHCYMELVEKEAKTDNLKAKARATIWASTYRMLRSYFESTTNQPLAVGLKIMVQVSVEFHELYGFSLNIKDIDPTYTLGDMQKRKLEIIRRLEKDGVMEMNKSLALPTVIQRIAVISSETAAGFGDFVHQLDNNSYGYQFHYQLFPSLVQGANADKSIIAAFDNIFESIDSYDVVVLIRGGGSKTDMSCFDSYDLAYYITQFPLPVLTGIGHERDDSIADMVAHTRLKTPTAVAEFIVNQAIEFEASLSELQDRLIENAEDILLKEVSLLQNFGTKIRISTIGLLERNRSLISSCEMKLNNSNKNYFQLKNQYISQILVKKIADYSKDLLKAQNQQVSEQKNRLQNSIKQFFGTKNHEIVLSEKTINLLNPSNILNRGYTLTTKNKIIIKSANQLNDNDIIETHFVDGTSLSKVIR